MLSAKTKVTITVIAIILIPYLSSELLYNTSFTKYGRRKTMRTYYLGRFSINIPNDMAMKIRSSKIRYVDIKELLWPKGVDSAQARTAEWERFMKDVRTLKPPEYTNQVIIQTNDLHSVGKWAKQIFYYNDYFDKDEARWSILMDAGPIGVWLVGDETLVHEEKIEPLMGPNIKNVSKAYQLLGAEGMMTKRPNNLFYLEYGAIDLPYLEQEEAIGRFEGARPKLTLLIEMETDFAEKRETMGLITATRGFLAAALIAPGGGASKIRLRKREVAGMPGEEAVIRVREGDTKDLVFTWQYNGKDNSGEYPATKIEMESPDGHLSEKLAIWDAVLDSMKPMFERKSHEP